MLPQVHLSLVSIQCTHTLTHAHMMIRPLVSIYGAPQTATKCLRKLLLNQHQLVVIILSFKSINKQLQCTQQTVQHRQHYATPMAT